MLHWIFVVSWPLIGWSVSAHLEANCRLNFAEILWANGYEPSQTWLAFGHAPLNFCCFLATDRGVGGAVRFLVVGTIGQEERPPRVSSGWSSVWHRSNTGLSSTQYEQIPIILGVWPFWLTPFVFRSITFWRAYGWIVFPLLKLLSFFWLTYYCSIGLCFSARV